MKRAFALFAAAMAAPAFAAIPYANPPGGVSAAGAGTYQGLLQQVPALPATTDQAFALFIYRDGELQPGQRFTSVEENLQRAGANLPTAQAAGGGNALMQHYSTPEGQAELKNMTQAQQMALAQQMAAAQMAQAFGPRAAPGPVSDHDAELMRSISPYSGMADVSMKMGQIFQAKGQLELEWREAEEKLGEQEGAAIAKLPACPGEAGEPSDISVRDVKRGYQPKYAALAQTYLAKFATMLTQLRGIVAPDIANADKAIAAWNQVENPALKQQVAPGASAAAGSALGDVTNLLAFTREASEHAARVGARKMQIEEQFANARGCS